MKGLLSLAECFRRLETDSDPSRQKFARIIAALRRSQDNDTGLNRRRFFAAVDAVLGGTAPETAAKLVHPARDDTTAFQFRRVSLQNWKVFQFGEFSFPALDKCRPVILIGGKNGFGKTSILEAILFALYGRRAGGDLVRSDGAGDVRSSGRNSYDAAIVRALHAPSRDRGERSISVRLEFDTAAGPLVVERRWYVDDTATRLDDEELVVQTGADGDLLSIPDGEEANTFYQAEIDRRLAPPSLAPYFLFDGEQIRRLAERELADQVRLGVEGALGVHLYRSLAEDLRDYARDRSRGSQAIETDAKLRAEAVSLDGDRVAANAKSAAIEAELAPLRHRRDEIVAAVGSIGRGTYDNLHELLEFSHVLSARETALRAEAVTAAAAALPMHLVGRDLVKRTRERLLEEASMVSASPDRAAEAELARFINAFDAQKPALADDLRVELHARIRAAWAAKSEGTSASGPFRHLHLADRRIEHVIARFDAAGDGREALTRLFEELSKVRCELQEVHAGMLAKREAEASLEARRAELETLNVNVARLESARRDLDNQIGRIDALLEAKSAELDRRSNRRPDGSFQKAELALRTATFIEAIIGGLATTQFARFGEVVTRIYRELAHKGTVQAVQISAEGEVALIDRGGRSFGTAAPSAGESQIFAMALIAAVTELAGSKLPVIVDTPLGRLDPEHRERILEFFTSRGSQTILLSQPDEVNGRYLTVIEDRIGATFHLEHDAQTAGTGSSVPASGYFPMKAA